MSYLSWLKRGLGLLKTETAHIQVEDPTPCRSFIYRYPEQAKELIANMLKEMQEKDITETSTEAWLSPTVLVNKPNREKRMCLDQKN